MCKRLGQPPVIGEIAAGILLGRELDPEVVRGERRTALTVALTGLALADRRVRARWTTS
ncbi:hypothetical protein [Streptomyces sp. NRRL S-1448]|uniref:hypothetical protein n=1 Tax=Streptomyces sp. NRRL S-1448 TaxID=1463883 RepID=UPI000AF1E08C|nr:hypothetical protein [Streptomyces sp. NRRL S-1448]